MAAKTKSKDLRSLIKEQRSKSKKKIDSPLARYNNAGQLFCILCNAVIKSDLLWDAHVRGAKHKEKLVSLKSSKERSEKTTGRNLSHPSASSSVTKNNTVPSSSNKRRAEDNNFVETSQRKPVVKKAKISSALDSIRNLSNSFEETSSVENDDMIVDDYESPNDNTSNMAGLPSDFFDSSQPKSEEIIDKAKQENLNETQKPEAIPEGFFDDPKLDAKARKVEYKDPADEEWEKFQKALSTENQVSEAIILEEDEESRVDRALDEISEQRLYYIRADVLRDKQVALKNSNKKNDDKIHEEMKVDNESDTDSDDIDDMFDWRAKKLD